MRSRGQAEQIIAALYGLDTETAEPLIRLLLELMGTAAFTDEAIIRLAAIQEEFHEAECRRLETEWRRSQRGY